MRIKKQGAPQKCAPRRDVSGFDLAAFTETFRFFVQWIQYIVSNYKIPAGKRRGAPGPTGSPARNQAMAKTIHAT